MLWSNPIWLLSMQIRMQTNPNQGWQSFFSVGGSSSAADSRGSARIRADSARIRPDPPDFRQHNLLADAAECPANVRRTPPDSARIRADPRGLRRELAELSAQKMSVRKKFQKISVRRGRPSATDVLPPRIRRGRFRRGHFRRGRSRRGHFRRGRSWLLLFFKINRHQIIT